MTAEELSLTAPLSRSPADTSVTAFSTLGGGGLSETELSEVEKWQNAMDAATLKVSDWAAAQVRQAMEANGTLPSDQLIPSDQPKEIGAEAGQDSDIVTIPIHLDTNTEVFLSLPVSLNTTAHELAVEIMREAALPLVPALFFNGSEMKPPASIMDHEWGKVRWTFSYEFEAHQDISLNEKLEEERERIGVAPDEWKRCFIMTDKTGKELKVGWNGNAVSMDFYMFRDFFPLSMRLTSKLLAKVHAAVATCSEDMTARIWDVDTGRCALVLQGHKATVNSACFTPDNSCIVTCSEDHTIKVWSLVTGECLHTLCGHSDSVSGASFSKDRGFLLTWSDDCTAKVWNWVTKECIFTFGAKGAHIAPLYIAFFSDDGATVTTASHDSKALLWDARNGRYLRKLKDLPPTELSSYSPGGRLTVTASPNLETSIWNIDTGKCELLLAGHERQVTFATYSPASQAMMAAEEAKFSQQ